MAGAGMSSVLRSTWLQLVRDGLAEWSRRSCTVRRWRVTVLGCGACTATGTTVSVWEAYVAVTVGAGRVRAAELTQASGTANATAATYRRKYRLRSCFAMPPASPCTVGTPYVGDPDEGHPRWSPVHQVQRAHAPDLVDRPRKWRVTSISASER